MAGGDSDFIEVHIDETGDRGVGPKSSPYFCMAAFAFRHSRFATIQTVFEDLNVALRRPAKTPIHAVKHLRSHDKMMEAVERISAITTARVFFVILPKSSIQSGSYAVQRRTCE